LPSKIIGAHDMTAAKCAENCAEFDYFGTEWSSECFCGRSDPAVPTPAFECLMPAGNPNEACSAGLRLNVYKFDAPTLHDDNHGG
jgi:hypothetical protein